MPDSWGVMAWTKIQSENKQRAITPKLGNTEYWFLVTTHCLNEIYPHTKFQVDTSKRSYK